MSKRKKRKPPRPRASTKPTSMDASLVGAFSQLARRDCSACGASIKWVGAEEATAHGMDVNQALQFLGLESPDDADIWICTKCDNGGVMGAATMGF